MGITRSISSTLVAFLLLASPCFAGHLHLEKDYQAAWCDGHGEMEYRLDDLARVDCLTETHAIEFDFGSKWAESIGQSLYYAIKTGKKPGVVLILEDVDDVRFLKRLRAVAKRYGIKVWTITPNDLKGD